MKIRSGFVSNSSSSSFVVLLPTDFDKESLFKRLEDSDNYCELMEENKITRKGIIERLELALKSKRVYREDNWREFQILEDLIPKKYILAEVETDSDRGEIVFVEPEKAREILNES